MRCSCGAYIRTDECPECGKDYSSNTSEEETPKESEEDADLSAEA